MALTEKQRRNMEVMKALRQVGRHIGMFGKIRKYPVLTDNEKFEALACVSIIADPKQSIVSKMACASILDYYLHDWREVVGKEVLGNVVERDSTEVSKWRKRVLERDGNQCTKCGSKENLEVHHIAHWAEYPELRLIEENGETLCNECHAKEHEGLANLILSRVG